MPALPTVSRYLLRRLAGPFLTTFTVVLLALSLERLLRVIEIITDEGAPVGQAFAVLLYLLPHYLSLALPASLFLGVLFAVRGLRSGSELTALLAAGVSLRRLAVPLVAFAGFCMIVMLLNTGFVQPHARYAYRATMHDVLEARFALRLKPGVFQEIGDNLVIRADEVSRSGLVLGGFFAEVTHDRGGRTVVTARAARLSQDRAADGIVLTLHDGTIVRDGAGDVPGFVRFGTYVWEPPIDAAGPYGPRGHGERELTLLELLAAGNLGSQAADPAYRTELHERLIHVLSLPALAWLAIPLGLLGTGRVVRNYGIVIGVAALVFYEKILGFGAAVAGKGTLSPWIGLWLPWATLVVAAAVLTLHASESNGRSFSEWLRGAFAAPRRRGWIARPAE